MIKNYSVGSDLFERGNELAEHVKISHSNVHITKESGHIPKRIYMKNF